MFDFKESHSSYLDRSSFLHGLGYVHPDIRWENVIKDINVDFLLTDLENAGREGPVNYHSQVWPTLSDKGGYTKVIDMTMVGQLAKQYELNMVGIL